MYSDIFFCCSLIELIGRTCKLRRCEVAHVLGYGTIQRIYNNAPILHCEPIKKTADVFITMCQIESGDFDNEGTCRYDVPDYWTIGDVYARLVEDINGADVAQTILNVYDSFASDSISNYNADFYYQSREYIYECYKAGTIL